MMIFNFRSPVPSEFRYGYLAMASACLVAGACHAQMTVGGTPDRTRLEQDRQRTQALVMSMSADAARPSDDAQTLGQSWEPAKNELSSAFSSRPEGSGASAAGGGEAASRLGKRPADPTGAHGQQMPSTESPKIARLVKRPAPIVQGEGKVPVFTPDFSRQQLTLAQLAGRTAIDLPVLESPTPQALPAPGVVAPADTLMLADLVQLGLEYSPVVKQAQAQLDNAVSQTRQSRAEFFPSATARYSAGPERNNTEGSKLDRHDYAARNLRLTQPLVNLPLFSSKDREAAAQLRLDAVRENVSLSVTKAVLDLSAARIVLGYSDQLLDQLSQVLKYVETRSQAGASSQADLERARTRVLAARQSRLEQQASYRNALLELQRLTGVTPKAISLPYLNQLPGLPATQAELRTLVAAHSLDLRALQQEVEAQQAAVHAERGRLLPVLGLSLENDRNSNVGASAPRENMTRALLVFSWGMNLGGKEIFAAQQAGAELRDKQGRLEEETNRVKQALDADFALLQSATLRISVGQSEQRAAKSVVDAVAEQLKTGRLGSLLDALDASERMFAANNRVVQTLVQQMQAQAQLLRRLGTLSQIESQARVSVVDAAPADASSSLAGAAPTSGR